jgi:hypothetical protein
MRQLLDPSMNALFMVLGYFETIIGRTLLLKFTLVSHLSSGTILELETSSFSCLVFILLCVIISFLPFLAAVVICGLKPVKFPYQMTSCILILFL